MKTNKFQNAATQILLAMIIGLALPAIWPDAPANAQEIFHTASQPSHVQETVLHSFGRRGDARNSVAGLVFDAAGNLYGTAENVAGSACQYCGAVFELSPQSGGKWAESVIYSFLPGQGDGMYPQAGLVVDGAGNLYGTTPYGGTGSCTFNIPGCGTVFELSPQAGGGWTETILHSFQNDGQDGTIPSASVILDNQGNLYGTTPFGGTCGFNCGTVFELSPQAGGNWTETILYSFQGGTDGQNPYDSLVQDSVGNLYGTTEFGGPGACTFAGGCGTVFELSPQSGGGWKEAVLYSFLGTNSQDGAAPLGGLIFDAAGTLYGTTSEGGISGCNFYDAGCGTVFKLTPRSGGSWTESVLYRFQFNGLDGILPQVGVILDAKGNLFGTTVYGGKFSGCTRVEPGCGTAYELSRMSGGNWVERVLVDFRNSGPGGNILFSGLISDSAGNLYGTDAVNGNKGGGTVFELIR